MSLFGFAGLDDAEFCLPEDPDLPLLPLPFPLDLFIGASMEENKPVFQQEIALSRLIDGLKSAESSNDSLESKASKLFAVSSGIIAAILGFSLIPRFQGGPKALLGESITASVVIVLLAASLVALLFVAWKFWGPRQFSISAISDTDKIYDLIISKSVDDAYNQVLIDAANQLENALKTNALLTSNLTSMFRITAFQVGVLCVGSVVRIICFWLSI